MDEHSVTTQPIRHGLCAWRSPCLPDFRSRRQRNSTRRLGSCACLALLVAIGMASPARAGTDQWTGNGPFGGLVSVLAVDPRTPANLYAAGFSGVFKSVNGGASWQSASNGITDPSIDALAIDPVTPTTLYAGSVDGGQLVKSIDGAASWTPVGPTLVVAVAVDPKTPATVYASQQQNGLSKSVDAGATWAPIGVASLPTFPTIRTIVVDPNTPSTLYAGDQNKGVFKSIDGGATWTPANTGIITGPIIQVLAMASDARSPGTLYLVANSSGASGLFKSVDGGASWSLLVASNSAAYNFSIGTVTVDPQTSGTVYIGTGAGTFKSTNGGTSFAPVKTGMPSLVPVGVVAINPQTPATVYAGTEVGVFASTNGGTAWAAANNGLALTRVTAVAVDPSTPTTVYAGTSTTGLFKSLDGGTSWSAINNGVGPTGNGACNTPQISSLAIDPQTPTTIYAGTQCTLSSGVLKSVDGGASWTPTATGLPAFVSVLDVVVDPVTTANLYAAMGSSGLYASGDGGAHWAPANGIPSGTYVSDVSADVIPAAAGGGSRIAVSTAGAGFFVSGTSASAAKFVPEFGFWYPGDLCDVIARLLTTYNARAELVNLVYAACESPYEYGGALSLGFASLFLSGPSVSVAKATPTTTIWASPNGNNASTSACSPVMSLVADPHDTSTFYVGAACGVLKGSNAGAQMVTMSAGLPPNLQVNALAITPSGSDLYAGTQGGGVYRYTPSGGAVASTPAVEFYNAAQDHYFMTWVPDEIAKLDAGTIVGWTRTGLSFQTYTTPQPGTSPVCRFYIPPGLGDSHFYGRGTAECNATAANNPTFVLEDPAFMQMYLPVGGVCPANTTEVFRVFDNRPDANHRYMTDKSVRAQMVAKGWIAEGDGPDLVVMCAPQ